MLNFPSVVVSTNPLRLLMNSSILIWLHSMPLPIIQRLFKILISLFALVESMLISIVEFHWQYVQLDITIGMLHWHWLSLQVFFINNYQRKPSIDYKKNIWHKSNHERPAYDGGRRSTARKYEKIFHCSFVRNCLLFASRIWKMMHQKPQHRLLQRMSLQWLLNRMLRLCH